MRENLNQALLSPILTCKILLQFPLQGSNLVNSIHTWTEVPFRNSGDYCCAFQDENDYFLNLETGVLAVNLPMYVATNINLTNGVRLILLSEAGQIARGFTAKGL